MAHRVYYSPYGGAVRAILEEADPRLELEVLQGTLRLTTIADDHEVVKHIQDPTQPTNLDLLIVTGERLQRRER